MLWRRRVPIRWLLLAAVLGGSLLIGIWGATTFFSPTLAVLKHDAELAERSGDLQRAARIVNQMLVRDRDHAPALLIALRVAVKQEHWREASAYLPRLTRPADVDSVETFATAGEAFFQAGLVDPAEDCLRRVLAIRPADISAHTRLAYILSCEGRRWESAAHLMELLKQGQPSVDLLLWLGNLQALVGEEALLETWSHRDPHAFGPRLGMAIRLLAQHDPVAAAQQLLPLVAERPDSAETGIQLGRAVHELGLIDTPSSDVRDLMQRGRAAFLQWHSHHRETCEAHPELWVLEGIWLLADHEREAARCFVEAIRRNPDQQFANYQLARLLRSNGSQASAEACSHRAEKLGELIHTMHLLYDNRQHVELMRQAAEQTEALGRLWETWGWYRMILAIDPKAEWAWQHSTRLKKQLNDEQPPRVLLTADPTAKLDLTTLPLPNGKSFSEASTSHESLMPRDPRDNPLDAPTATIRFQDLTRDAGLDFTFFNSPHTEGGERSFEFTGGGIAIIDYDADGWPDIYFTQGCRWPHQPGQREHLDQLFRNVAGERFENVTAASEIVEDQFSQGVTVGDYDSDGFPDLYVANIGPNRCLRNNGDGTFSDVSRETGASGGHWSTSCVFADMNADGHPDLYVVNYLAGDDVFERICHNPDGTARLCYPQVFPSAPDKFYLNLGDGTFLESSENCGIRDTTGRGLGIVAADFEGNGRLNLFVANDTTANFYWRNHGPDRSGLPKFTEEGISSGLAFDHAGQAQACMGVASADADRDGRLDLFVTNFEKEYNNLYLQPATGLFVDAITKSGIKDAGYSMLGFGTQFFDADRDGWPDLFVANGHIDDFTRYGTPYTMPPQLFHNVQHGRFRERKGSELGTYFAGRYLGRAAARVDWNRDGLDELVIGHLRSPSVLLANRTESAGSSLAIELRGVTSSRDAIGTRIELRAGGDVGHYQLVAGDGYQASNDRRLVMGTGSSDRIDEIVILWPSGLRQSFEHLPTASSWLVIEGRATPVRLPK